MKFLPPPIASWFPLTMAFQSLISITQQLSPRLGDVAPCWRWIFFNFGRSIQLHSEMKFIISMTLFCGFDRSHNGFDWLYDGSLVWFAFFFCLAVARFETFRDKSALAWLVLSESTRVTGLVCWQKAKLQSRFFVNQVISYENHKLNLLHEVFEAIMQFSFLYQQSSFSVN